MSDAYTKEEMKFFGGLMERMEVLEKENRILTTYKKSFNNLADYVRSKGLTEDFRIWEETT